MPLILVLLFALAVFCPLLRCGFLNWDDPITIQHNPRLFPPTVHGLAQNWSQTQGHLYVPVTYTLWWLVAAVARQPQAGWFHALNILIHLSAVAGVFAVLRLIGFGSIAAMIGTAIFAVHPVQVETVAWCSGTKDLLAGALGIWAVYLAGRRRILWGTALFALALLAKPTAVVFALLAGILAARFLGRRKAILLVVVWLAMCVPVVMIGRLTQTTAAAEFVVPMRARPAVALDAVGFYLEKIIWPVRLATDYGHSPLNVLGTTSMKIRVVIVLILVAAVWLARRRLKGLWIGPAVFVSALLPVLGFVPFDFQSYSTTADHYLYVAMLGVAIVVACMARHRVMLPILIAVILLLAGRTIYQEGYWQNSVTLFAHDLQVNPESQAAHVNLAIALADRGEWDAADLQYRKTLRLNFANFRAQLGVGQILALRRQTQRALGHMQIASRLGSDDPLVHYDLAVALAHAGQPTEAISEYEKALAIEPNFAAAQTNLGTLLLLRGDLRGAEMHYRAALRVNPDLTLPRKGLEEIARDQRR